MHFTAQELLLLGGDVGSDRPGAHVREGTSSVANLPVIFMMSNGIADMMFTNS